MNEGVVKVLKVQKTVMYTSCLGVKIRVILLTNLLSY